MNGTKKMTEPKVKEIEEVFIPVAEQIEQRFLETHTHFLTGMIEEENVTINLQTKDIGQVTELDKEYSKWADELYKDIVYGHSSE